MKFKVLKLSKECFLNDLTQFPQKGANFRRIKNCKIVTILSAKNSHLKTPIQFLKDGIIHRILRGDLWKTKNIP